MVRGTVIDVESSYLVTIETLVIQDPDGRLWTFYPEGPLEFTPSHLREHQALGLAITVRYVDRDRILVPVGLED